jgi:hypothetical protein
VDGFITHLCYYCTPLKICSKTYPIPHFQCKCRVKLCVFRRGTQCYSANMPRRSVSNCLIGCTLYSSHRSKSQNIFLKLLGVTFNGILLLKQLLCEGLDPRLTKISCFLARQEKFIPYIRRICERSFEIDRYCVLVYCSKRRTYEKYMCSQS